MNVPSPTPRHFPFCRGSQLQPSACLPGVRPALSLARWRLHARAGRGEAEGPGPGAAAAILRSRGGASRVLPALLPVPGSRPWPPGAVGRCLGGCGWAVTLERVLGSATGRGGVWGWRKCVGRRSRLSAAVGGSARRGGGAAAPDWVPRASHPSASSRGWVEPAPGPCGGGCCLPFCLVLEFGCQVRGALGRRRSPRSPLVMTYPVVLAETQARAGRKAMRQPGN